MVKPTIENVEAALNLACQYLPEINGLKSAAFYGFSPVNSKSETPDLDLLLIRGEEQLGAELNECLQHISTVSNLILDVWVLPDYDLLDRMRRVAAKLPQPEPRSEIGDWNKPAYIAIFGKEILEDIINDANRLPLDEPMIPPTPESKLFFQP